jgi:2-polyprenyl-3-methyl-5-hydroxy-6-metoxy-1,4-benzoquinol methylase
MRTEVDNDQLKLTILQLYLIKQGEMLSALTHLGTRLDLWRALGEHGPCTSAELAESTGLQERWVREWLYGVAAADLAQHDDGRFALMPEVDVLMNDETHPGHMQGVFGPPMTHHEIDRTIEAFETGIGMTWDEHGDHTCHMQAAMGAAGQEAFLVPVILAALDGATEKLAEGATIVDIGCGAGVAACVLARAFPNSSVLGLDPSGRAIAAARTRAAEAGLTNATFEVGTFADLESHTPCDLLLTLDVLHDLPRPDEAIASARAALTDDGWWLVADIKGTGDYETNRKIPVLPYMYSMSVFYCMSSSLSEPDGAGLGTLGMHAALFEQMATDAGFSRFTVHDHDHDPTNRYYEVRP